MGFFDLFQKRPGAAGEAAACRYLKKRGFVLLEKNWRRKSGEIDLIMKDGECLVVVEVKSRAKNPHLPPEVNVGVKKQKKLIALARRYLSEQKLEDAALRFDVVSVTGAGQRTPEIVHFEDAFRVK